MRIFFLFRENLQQKCLLQHVTSCSQSYFYAEANLNLSERFDLQTPYKTYINLLKCSLDIPAVTAVMIPQKIAIGRMVLCRLLIEDFFR